MDVKSIHGLSHSQTNKGVPCLGDRIANHKTAIHLLTDSGMLVGVGRLPTYFDGVRVTGRAAAARQLELMKGTSNTQVSIKWCMDEKLGYEKVLNIKTFKSQAAFDRTLFCRKSGSYSSQQLEFFETQRLYKTL